MFSDLIRKSMVAEYLLEAYLEVIYEVIPYLRVKDVLPPFTKCKYVNFNFSCIAKEKRCAFDINAAFNEILRPSHCKNQNNKV